MDLQRLISRKLHDEHVAVLDLLDRFERALVRLQGAPAADDATWSLLLAQVATALQHEVSEHFRLEEEALFPRLRESGEGDLAELLLEEHESVRSVARPLLELLGRARTGSLDAAGWKALKLSGLELVERLGAHARKEEGSLVPVVDELLDEATDGELYAVYGLT